MTQRQKFLLFVSVISAALLVAYPPFVIPGRMLDDIVYAPLWHPPPSNYPDEKEYQITLCSGLLLVEFAVLAIMTATGLFFLRRKWAKAGA